MKKAITLLLVMAMILTMIPSVFAAEAEVLVDVADQAVTADVPYVYEGVAETAGTLTVTPSGSPSWGFKVTVGDNEGMMQNPDWSPEYNWTVEAGQSYKVEVYAYNYSLWSSVDGTVGLKLTFAQGGSAAEEKKEYVFDETYNDSNPLKVGTYQLTLSDAAEHILYSFYPDEIGVYTLTVNEGAVIGYWGASTAWFTNPNSTATSIDREIKAVGQGILFGISSDSGTATLTIEKTGESEGIVETVYTDWENKHTPSAEYAGTPEGMTLTEVDITVAHTAVMGEDGFFHMDSADGPRLYVDLTSTNFNLTNAYGQYGALTMRGEYEGVDYDFKAAMKEYNTVITGTDGVYPMTEDLVAFLKGYGYGAAFWYDPDKSSLEEIQAGNYHEDSAWLALAYYGEVEEETEPPAHEHFDGCEHQPIEISGEYTATQTGTMYYAISDVDNYSAMISGEGLVSAGYNGETIDAVDGKLIISGLTGNADSPAVFSLTGDGTFEIGIAPALGSAENPDTVIIGDNAVVASTDGYELHYIPECSGTLTITMTSDDWMLDMGEWAFGTCDDGENTFVIEAVAGEQLVMMLYPVYSYDPVEICFTAEFTHPQGCAHNPIMITAEYTATQTGTVYYAINNVTGFEAYITGTGLVSAAYEGVSVSAADDKVLLTDLTAGRGKPAMFSITGDGTFRILIQPPVGSWQNPDTLVLGDTTVVATADGYELHYIAPANGTLTVTMNCEDWMLTLGSNDQTDCKEGSKVNTLEVTEGEEIAVIVAPGISWDATEITFHVAFEAEPLKEGLHKGEDGNFYYYVAGKVATDFTGLVENTFGVWYIKEGVAQVSYDGLIEFEGTKYLIKAGCVSSFTGISKQEGVYYYFTSGVNDLVYEGLVLCNGMKAYVQDGEVNFNKTGVVEDEGNLVYVKYGIWRNTFKGLARSDDGSWLYFVNGTFDATYTGVAKLNSLWVYVNEGFVDFKFSGVFNVNGVDYTIKYGVVQF